MTNLRRVGVLTGGGDAPGLNAALCGVSRRVKERGVELVGLRNGWQGLIDNDVVEGDFTADPHLVTRGGTVLGSRRPGPTATPSGMCPSSRRSSPS